MMMVVMFGGGWLKREGLVVRGAWCVVCGVWCVFVCGVCDLCVHLEGGGAVVCAERECAEVGFAKHLATNVDRPTTNLLTAVNNHQTTNHQSKQLQGQPARVAAAGALLSARRVLPGAPQPRLHEIRLCGGEMAG